MSLLLRRGRGHRNPSDGRSWARYPLATGLFVLSVLLLLALSPQAWAKDLTVATFPAELAAQPATSNDTIFVPLKPAAIAAVDVNSGKVRWQIKLAQPIASLSVSRGVLFANTLDGSIFQITTERGSVGYLFNSPETGPPIPGAQYHPAFEGNVVYATTPLGALVALDRGSKRRLWEYDGGEGPLSPPALGGRLVLVGSDNGVLHAIAATKGKADWQYQAGSTGIRARPVYGGGRVFVADWDGRVYGLTKRGRPEWSADLEANIELPLLYADRTLFAATSNGTVYALRPEDGQVRWRFDAQGFLLSELVSRDSILYFGSNDGRFYSVSNYTGRSLSTLDLQAHSVSAPVFADGRGLVAASFAKGKEAFTKIVPIEGGGSPASRGRRAGPQPRAPVPGTGGAAGWLVEYFALVALDTTTRYAPDRPADGVASWPVGALVQGVAAPVAEASARIPETARNVNGRIANSPALSRMLYLYAVMFSPLAALVSLTTMLYAWVFILLLSAGPFLVLSVSPSWRGRLRAWAAFILRTATGSIRPAGNDWLVIAVTFLAGILALGVLRVLPWLGQLSYFYFVALFGWTNAILLAAISRGFSFNAMNLASSPKESPAKPANVAPDVDGVDGPARTQTRMERRRQKSVLGNQKEVWRRTKTVFWTLVLLYGVTTAVAALSIILLGSSLALASPIPLLLSLPLAGFLLLFAFAETFVLKGGRAVEAITKSVGLCRRRIPELLTYFFVLAAILVPVTLVYWVLGLVSQTLALLFLATVGLALAKTHLLVSAKLEEPITLPLEVPRLGD